MERADPSDNFTFLSRPNCPQQAVMLPTAKVLPVGAAPISSGCSVGLARAGLALPSRLGAQWDPEVPALPFPLSSQEGPSLPCSPGPAHNRGEVLPPAVAPGAPALRQALLPRSTACSARSCPFPAEATALCKGETTGSRTLKSCLRPALRAFLRVLAPQRSSLPRERGLEPRLHPELLPAVPSGMALPLLISFLSTHPSASLVWQRMKRLKSLATVCIILLCLGAVFAVSGNSVAFRSCTKLASPWGQTVQNHLFP